MKRIAVLAVIGTGLLALPSSASAQLGAVNCPAGVQVSASYVCVHSNGLGGEAVLNPPSCSYVNAWSTNPVTAGYAGFGTSCPETGTKDMSCNGIDEGSGSNSGGCFWIKPAPEAVNRALQNPVTAMLICHVDASGEDPANVNRDGCSLPPDLCSSCRSRSVTSERAGAEKRNGRGRG